ncbi:hypothetical protein V1478_015114 [Vespula squamosa]|uniref:Uncharacterized protein n=1 Tax=Vespula squamosa TaxID=30214 RepID=A0ABD2A4Y5_VESSQ
MLVVVVLGGDDSSSGGGSASASEFNQSRMQIRQSRGRKRRQRTIVSDGMLERSKRRDFTRRSKDVHSSRNRHGLGNDLPFIEARTTNHE